MHHTRIPCAESTHVYDQILVYTYAETITYTFLCIYVFMNEIKAYTHTHTFLRTFTECKGNPAILHLHSKHPLPFGADPVTTLHLTHSPVTYCDTQMHTCSLRTLTPSWGAGGGGIATAHFASMQPPSERNPDAQEEEGATQGGDPKHIGNARTRAKVKVTHPFLRVTEGSSCGGAGRGGGGTHASRLVPAAWQRAESGVEACRRGLLYIHTVYTGREGGGKEMLCPHMICSFPPPWHGCPGNQ